MRLGRSRKNEPSPPVDELGLREWLRASEVETQASVVEALLAAIRPFGQLDPDVVEPGVLDSQIGEVLDALAHPLRPATTAALTQLQRIPAINAHEEPEGLGFFALGAAVVVLYAARFAQGDRSYATQALSRAAEMVGFADDDLGTEIYPALVASLCAHAASASNPPIDTEVITSIAEQAASLSEQSQ